MKRVIMTILMVFIFLFLPSNSYAANIAGNSAEITYNSISRKEESDLFVKKLAIKEILDKYSAPLADFSDSFIKACSSYNLDCYLLPSIAGLESTFGKFVYPNSYNPFGWGRGYIMFSSWRDGIEKVGKGLRDNYISKGANSVEQIASMYSESPTWSSRVKHFMTDFEKKEQELQLYLNKNAVEL